MVGLEVVSMLALRGWRAERRGGERGGFGGVRIEKEDPRDDRPHKKLGSLKEGLNLNLPIIIINRSTYNK